GPLRLLTRPNLAPHPIARRPALVLGALRLPRALASPVGERREGDERAQRREDEGREAERVRPHSASDAASGASEATSGKGARVAGGGGGGRVSGSEEGMGPAHRTGGRAGDPSAGSGRRTPRHPLGREALTPRR